MANVPVRAGESLRMLFRRLMREEFEAAVKELPGRLESAMEGRLPGRVDGTVKFVKRPTFSSNGDARFRLRLEAAWNDLERPQAIAVKRQLTARDARVFRADLLSEEIEKVFGGHRLRVRADVTGGEGAWTIKKDGDSFKIVGVKSAGVKVSPFLRGRSPGKRPVAPRLPLPGGPVTQGGGAVFGVPIPKEEEE